MYGKRQTQKATSTNTAKTNSKTTKATKTKQQSTSRRRLHTALASTSSLINGTICTEVITTQRRKMALRGRPGDQDEMENLLQSHTELGVKRPQRAENEPIPQAALDHFLGNEPELMELMKAAESGKSSKITGNTKADTKAGEQIFIRNAPDEFKAIMSMQRSQAMDEQFDEEALIDSLLYNKMNNDPDEENLRQQHKQLKEKQRFLNQQRVLNMNEFIKPPTHDNINFFEQSLNSSTSNHAQILEESLEHRDQLERFQKSIADQRLILQKQLDEAAAEEQSQIKTAKKQQKRLIRQQQLQQLQQLTQPPTTQDNNTMAQKRTSGYDAGIDDSENDAIGSSESDDIFDPASQHKRRAGPAFGEDFMANHDLFNDADQGPTNTHRLHKKSRLHPLRSRRPDVDDEDGDGDGMDDLDENEQEQFDEDINSILSRQMTADPALAVQGIAYDDFDSDEDTGESDSEDVHEEPNLEALQRRALKKAKKQHKMNKFGNVIVEDSIGNVDPYAETPDNGGRKHDGDDIDGNLDADSKQWAQNGRDQGQADDEDDEDGPVQDFEFPERVDAGVKKQAVNISPIWWKRVHPIIKSLKSVIDNPTLNRNANLLQGLDAAARMLLELSSNPNLPDIPRQVFAHIINIAVPKIKTIHGIPQGSARPATAALGPFLLLVMKTARQNHVKFSDVEWQWVLTTMAQTANVVNSDDVKQILDDTIALFRKSKITRGVRIKRDKSTGIRVSRKSAQYTRFALISAPNVRLIEQRAWLEFYTYSHNRDILLPFTRIHDAVVFKPSHVQNSLSHMGFIADHIGDDIMSRPLGVDFHRVDEAFEFDANVDAHVSSLNDDPLFNANLIDGTPIPPPRTDFSRLHKFAHYKDHLHNSLGKPLAASGNEIMLDEEATSIRTEKAFKNWVSPDHHPQLFNYPAQDGLPYNAYMAAPDDILAEPWMYQPPHFGEQYLPRMSAQFRNDNLAFFPSCISVMAHFTAQGTADLAQAEQFYKYMVSIFTNTEGYYRSVLRDLKKIDQYRTLHGYEPAEDTQMAQNCEAPEGEEFRYFAGYPLVDGLDFQSWRKRATHTIITTTKLLAKLYRHENRAPQISNLIQYLLEQKRLYPALVPVPSMSLLQQYFHSSIRTRDIAQARQTVTLMLHLRQMVATPNDDPLLQLSLGTIRFFQDRAAKRTAYKGEKSLREGDHADPGSVGVGTNRRFHGQTFHNTDETKQLLQRMGQASFDSLQRELDVAVIIAQAAIYAVTNNFVAIMELIDSLSKVTTIKMNATQSENAKHLNHDQIKSLQNIGPETKTRLFRVIFDFLATSNMQQNNHVNLGHLTAKHTQAKVESVYHHVKADFDRSQAQQYPKETLDQLPPETRQQFEELRTQLFHKRVRDMIQPIYDELLSPKPLIDYQNILSESKRDHWADHGKDDDGPRMTSPATLEPGHIIWMFHQSQRHGAALTPRLVHDTLNLLASFPGNIGSYAAYKFVNDMLGLGFRISRPTLRVIAAQARSQAQLARPQLNKLYKNETIHTIYEQLKDTAVTIPQLLDQGRTELPTVFFKEFSFLHPSTVFSLAKHKNIPLSAVMMHDTIYYFGLTRNWVAAVESFRNALDIAYFGDYSLIKRICKAQKIPLSKITDALPIKQRRIAFNARKALFLSSTGLAHHRLTYDIIQDWQQADGVKLLPYTLGLTNHSIRVRNSKRLGPIAKVSLFPTDLNDPRFESIAPLILPFTPLPQLPAAKDQVITDANGAVIQSINNQQDKNVHGATVETAVSTSGQITLRNKSDSEIQVQVQEAIEQLPFDQQKMLIQTITKIKHNRQPPISQHLSIAKHSKLVHDVHDLTLITHGTGDIVWQRRFMEASGINPTFSTIHKIFTAAISLATYAPDHSSTTSSRVGGGRRRNLTLKTHISRVTNSDTIHLPPSQILFTPALSVATPITNKTNKQIGTVADFPDFENLDEYQARQARVMNEIEPYWEDVKDDVLKSSKLTAQDRSMLQNAGRTEATRAFFYDRQFDELLRTKLLPNHYSNVYEHTLTIKLSAQRLLDHYPFSNAHEAIKTICNTRIGLGDLGLEYEPHKAPLLTTVVPDPSGERISSSNNQRAISTKLQQHQRSYQNMTKMKHEGIILPLNLMLDSPAVHVPGLALYLQVPKNIDIPQLDEDSLPPISESEEQEFLDLSDASPNDASADDNAQAHVAAERKSRANAIVSLVNKQDLFKNKWTKRYNTMVGTEHIDASLAEVYWRGLTICPANFYGIVSDLLKSNIRLPHVPQTGLMVIPYVAALTHNMNIFPLLDRYSRPAHPLSSTNIRQHHTIHDLDRLDRTPLSKVSADGNELINEIEERVIQQFSDNTDTNNHNVSLQTDNVMVTLNKLTGITVTYQHQVVALQFDLTAQLNKQLTMVLSDIIGSIITPSHHQFQRKRALVPYSSQQRSRRERGYLPRQALNFSLSLPFPSLLQQLPPEQHKDTKRLGFNGTLDFVSLVADHFHGLDVVLRRLVDFLPPVDNPSHQGNKRGTFVNTKSTSSPRDQLIDQLVAANANKGKKDSNKPHGGTTTNDDTATTRQELLYKLALSKPADSNSLSKQFVPTIPDLILPTTKPLNLPRYYNRMRDNTRVKNTTHSYVDDVPDFTPKPTNYTESSLLHVPSGQHEQLVETLAQLPLLQANLNHIMFHPQFGDDFLLLNPQLHDKNMFSSNFDFAPRVSSNNKQSQLVFMLLARYKQPAHIIEQHITNWNDSSQHTLEMIHLAFKQLFNMDLSNRGEAVSAEDPHFDSQSRINTIINGYKDAQDPMITKSQLIVGLIDIAISTLPTKKQLKWFDDLIEDQIHDIELLEAKLPQLMAAGGEEQGESNMIASPETTLIQADIAARKKFTTHLSAFVNEMKSCLTELDSINTYLPQETQFSAISTYLQHVTLTPAPYNPETSDAQSQSYKLWSKEALLSLQSIRLAPNQQQLAVTSNTGPIVNYQMFDANYLFKGKNPAIDGEGVQNPDFYPLDESDLKSKQRRQMQNESSPAEIVLEDGVDEFDDAAFAHDQYGESEEI